MPPTSRVRTTASTAERTRRSIRDDSERGRLSADRCPCARPGARCRQLLGRLDMQRLQNKVAIVAGGATGIGAACAKRFVAEGARVIIGDMNVATVQELAASLGANAFAVRYDASDGESVRKLIESAIEKFGRIDVLHNNVALTSQAVQKLDTTVTDI